MTPRTAAMEAMPPAAALAEADDRLAAKVRRRLLPFLFLLYVVAYLDRINVGFAALEMNRDLGLTGQQYGLLSGIFFWGYVLFELPSNLVLHRVGARKWIARILLSWGIVALGTGFVQDATELYVARFLLGVAEAGFFPGILYYLTIWFRPRERAQAIALFMMAVPTASILGGPVSGWILDHVHSLGIASWRWLLILEALPAIACGVLTARTLPDRPAEARFLTGAERRRLEELLQSRAEPPAGAHRWPVLQSLLQPRVLHFAAIHVLFLMGLYVASFWMPQSIKASAGGASNTTIGILVLVPNVLGLAAMLLVSRSSDRSGERHLHTALPLLTAALGLWLVGSAQSLAACVTLWCVVSMGVMSYFGPFWTGPGQALAGRNAAAGFAFVNSVGSVGSYIASSVMGAATERSGSLAGGFRTVAAGLALAALLVLAQKLHRHRALPALATDAVGP